MWPNQHRCYLVLRGGVGARYYTGPHVTACRVSDAQIFDSIMASVKGPASVLLRRSGDYWL